MLTTYYLVHHRCECNNMPAYHYYKYKEVQVKRFKLVTTLLIYS